MAPKVTRMELNGSLVRIEGKIDGVVTTTNDLRVSVATIEERVSTQHSQCSDCAQTMEVLAKRVNGLDSWRVTARRMWVGLIGLLGAIALVIGILAATGVLHV